VRTDIRHPHFSRGGDRELENEVRGENRRFSVRIGQRIDFVQRKAAHARRERNEQIERSTSSDPGLVPPDAARVQDRTSSRR